LELVNSDVVSQKIEPNSFMKLLWLFCFAD